MPRISRAARADIQRNAHQIRQQGQRAGWRVEQIAATIRRRHPTVIPLEAWRLAYGWSRQQVIDGLAALYLDDGLIPPAVNTSMLCRWEHDGTAVSVEYAAQLVRLYRASPVQLGLADRVRAITLPTALDCYGRNHVAELVSRTNGNSPPMTTGQDNEAAAALAAVRESIQLALDAEGPAGGPLTVEHLHAAVAYYALHYAVVPPVRLATEVHLCRALITAALGADPVAGVRLELRRSAGWMSALLGNLSFHLADHTAAHIHLGTASRLGVAVGDDELVSWSLGAQSMVAFHQDRPVEALDLARQAVDSAGSPRHRAQALAWAQLRPVARLGRATEARATMRDAQRAMEIDPVGDRPGRFGFDMTELELHLAEAHILLDDAAAAADHAETSRQQARSHGPAWAAATAVLARTEALRHRPDEAASLGHLVLDAIPPHSLRETSRKRLHDLDAHLQLLDHPGRQATDFHNRLTSLPPHAARPSDPTGP